MGERANPISGIFVKIAPKPMGSNKRGSNFLLMARYKIIMPTPSIINCPEVALKMPKFKKIASKFISMQSQTKDRQASQNHQVSQIFL